MSVAEQNTEQTKPTEEQPEHSGGRSRRRFIIIGVVAVLVAGALLFWWHSTYYEDTDDASVDGHLVQISSRISGQVLDVKVEQNQYVDAGTLLVQIDPTDFQTAVNQAEANLEAAEASYEAARVNVPVININTGSSLNTANADLAGANATVAQSERQLQAAQARVTAAKANYTKAKLDLERYTPLVEKDIISKQQFDAAVAAASSSEASVNEAQANLIAAQDAVRIAKRPRGAGAVVFEERADWTAAGRDPEGQSRSGGCAGGSGQGAARAGEAEPELHADHRARCRHHHDQKR